MYIKYANLNVRVVRSLCNKLRKRKVKTLTRNWRDHKMTGTHKHTETVTRYFDWHGSLPQSKESKCLWTHDKDGVTHKHLLSFDWGRLPCQSKNLVTVSTCLCLPVISWSLQFLVRVFSFLSLNLQYYFVLFVLQYFPFHMA